MQQQILDRLYAALGYVALGLFLPVGLLRWWRTPALRARFGERFGRYDPSVRDRLAEGERPVWIHAVSMGEVRAVLPLVRALTAGEIGPPRRIVLSTVTVTGNATARELVPEGTTVLFLPVDVGPVVARALDAIRPRLFVSTESEIWPALLRELERRAVPAAIVNGRFSERSAARYRWLGFFMRGVLARVRLFAMQNETFASRVVAMGAPAERVAVLGNLKYDLAAGPIEAQARARLRGELGLGSERPLLVAGSTHEGEERALLDAMQSLDGRAAGFDLLLAPRHPERFEAVAALLAERGLAHHRRSAGAAPGPVRVTMLDTMGELTRLYAVGDVAFVGGTLVPIGGHNLLEPAAAGLPALFGEHTFSCADIAEGLLGDGGGIRVGAGPGALADALEPLVRDPDARRIAGEAARGFLAAHRGATERTARALEELAP